jgi:hypothetical protein
MKKAFLLLFIIVLSTKLTKAQTDWINYKVDDKVSVQLPAQPQFKQGGQYVKDKDSSVYIVMAIDFVKVAGVDSVQLAPYEPTPEFANQLKTGILSKMSGSTLGDVKIGKWNGHYSYAMEGGNEAKKLKIYVNMVCWGNTMYALMNIVPEQNSTKGRDYFFASLKAN